MEMAFNSVCQSSYDIGETDGSNSEYKLRSFNKNNVCVDLSHASLSEFPFAKVIEPSHLQVKVYILLFMVLVCLKYSQSSQLLNCLLRYSVDNYCVCSSFCTCRGM